MKFLKACLHFVLLLFCAHSFAAGSIRTAGGNITTTNTGNTNTPSVSVQTGIAASDVICIDVLNSGSHTISAWPSGFTAIGTTQVGSNIGYSRQTACKTASGSESGSFAMTATGYDSFQVTSFTVTGVSTTIAAVNTTNNSSSYGTTNTLTGGSVTTGATNQFIVWLGLAGNAGGVTSVSSYNQPSGFTTANSALYSGNYAAIILAYKTEALNTTTSYSGSIVWNAVAANDSFVTTLVFTPSGGGAATLSSPTPSGTLGTSTTATTGATTDTSSGTLYSVVDSGGNLSGVTATQIKAGQKASGASAAFSCNATVSTTTPSCGVTGLTASTAYAYAEVQDTGSNSNVVTGTFTTGATATATAGRASLLGVGR